MFTLRHFESWPLRLWLCLLVWATVVPSSLAQRLEFSPSREPDLGALSWHRRRAVALAGEVPTWDDELSNRVHSALNGIAAHLLSVDAGVEPSVRIHAIDVGHRLADSSDEIVRALERSRLNHAHALSAIERFLLGAEAIGDDEDGAGRLWSVGDVHVFEERLRRVCEPLRDAMSPMSDERRQMCLQQIEELRVRIESLSVRGGVPDALAQWPDEFAALSAQSGAIALVESALSASVRLFEVVDRIEAVPYLQEAWTLKRSLWLEPARAGAECDCAIVDVEWAWEHLLLIDEVLTGIDMLEGFRDESLRLAAYRRALEAAITGSDRERGVRSLKELDALIGRAVALRSMERPPRQTPILRAAKVLDDHAKRCEQRTVELLALHGSDAMLGGDPEYLTLVHAHERTLEAIANLSVLESAVDSLCADESRRRGATWRMILESAASGIEPLHMPMFQAELASLVEAAQLCGPVAGPASISTALAAGDQTIVDGQNRWIGAMEARRVRLREEWLSAYENGERTTRIDNELSALGKLAGLIEAVQVLDGRVSGGERWMTSARDALVDQLQRNWSRIDDPGIALVPVVESMRLNCLPALVCAYLPGCATPGGDVLVFVFEDRSRGSDAQLRESIAQWRNRAREIANRDDRLPIAPLRELQSAHQAQSRGLVAAFEGSGDQ